MTDYRVSMPSSNPGIHSTCFVLSPNIFLFLVNITRLLRGRTEAWCIVIFYWIRIQYFIRIHLLKMWISVSFSILNHVLSWIYLIPIIYIDTSMPVLEKIYIIVYKLFVYLIYVMIVSSSSDFTVCILSWSVSVNESYMDTGILMKSECSFCLVKDNGIYMY